MTRLEIVSLGIKCVYTININSLTLHPGTPKKH